MQSGGVCPIQQYIFQNTAQKDHFNQIFMIKTGANKVVIMMIISTLENEYIKFEL